MKTPRRKYHYLVGKQRAAELKQLGHDLITYIRELQDVYGVQLHCSYEGNFIEILDPKAEIPEGYGYVSSLHIDEGDVSYEVSELIKEDRKVEASR